jgi:hypothetical protein
MPSPGTQKHETLSRIRHLFNSASGQEKFISWHPDRYGFDGATYAAVVVVVRDRKTEVRPARTYDEARRIYHAL